MHRRHGCLRCSAHQLPALGTGRAGRLCVYRESVRFVTHVLRLRDARAALANFFAPGLLALGPTLAPSCGNCRPVWGTTPVCWRRCTAQACDLQQASIKESLKNNADQERSAALRGPFVLEQALGASGIQYSLKRSQKMSIWRRRNERYKCFLLKISASCFNRKECARTPRYPAVVPAGFRQVQMPSKGKCLIL